MTPEQLYDELKQLAERLGITVSEQNLKSSGFKVKSGLCTVMGQKMLIIEKTKAIDDKIDLIAEYVGAQPLDSVYLLPAVRERLSQYAHGQQPVSEDPGFEDAPDYKSTNDDPPASDQ